MWSAAATATIAATALTQSRFGINWAGAWELQITAAIAANNNHKQQQEQQQRQQIAALYAHSSHSSPSTTATVAAAQLRAFAHIYFEALRPIHTTVVLETLRSEDRARITRGTDKKKKNIKQTKKLFATHEIYRNLIYMWKNRKRNFLEIFVQYRRRTPRVN